MSNIQYRIYADDSIVNEEDFEEHDNSLPYYDDYALVSVPEEIVQHIIDESGGK